MYRLNKKQSEAVETNDSFVVVVAGPGTGKTTVITNRVKFILENYNIVENDILVITFTRSAALEMHKRCQKIIRNNNVLFCTFHSIFFKMINEKLFINAPNILKETERERIIDEIYKKIVCDNIDFDNNLAFSYDNKTIFNKISLIKNNLQSIESIECDRYFKKIYHEYENFKKSNKKIDFDDILVICYDMLKHNSSVLQYYRNKYKFILIDEFQDINLVQYECVKLLSENKNLFVVGDDDQSIYAFRGAHPDFFLNFSSHFSHTKKIVLDINYRSTNRIIELCNRVIKQNHNRFQKYIVGTGNVGSEPQIMCFKNIEHETKSICEFIKNNFSRDEINNTAVIFRVNTRAILFVNYCMHFNLNYLLKDKIDNLYNHWAVKDIITYLRLSLNPDDINLITKIINRPNRYISYTDLMFVKKNSRNDILINLSRDERLLLKKRGLIYKLQADLINIRKLSAFEAIKYIRQVINYDKFIKINLKKIKIKSEWVLDILNEAQYIAKSFSNIETFIDYVDNFGKSIKNSECGITLSTMHSAKGLEFDNVFVVTAIESVIPHIKSTKKSQLEEELRLFYVALTRAKRHLFITYTKNKYELPAKPSRFIKDITKHYIQRKVYR
jgi:DNA helicase-2/ATP-dependent DNA helicase PcrA